MVDVLDREMYTVAEAARLLDMPDATLRYWLEGGNQRGIFHPAIIRLEPRPSRNVTWAEFVEAGLLREYRKDLQVPMGQLRDFINELRRSFNVPYPLAHSRPLALGRQLVLEAQERAGLADEFHLVEYDGGQFVLTEPSSRFLRRVTWAPDGTPADWNPSGSAASHVRVDPSIRFGRPAVKGISTEVLREHAESGETEREIADTFSLTVKDVRDALSYEKSRATA